MQYLQVTVIPTELNEFLVSSLNIRVLSKLQLAEMQQRVGVLMMVVMVVMGAQEARGVVVMVVMMVVPVVLLQIRAAAGRRGVCPTTQLLRRTSPLPDPWALSLLALTLLLEAKWPCL